MSKFDKKLQELNTPVAPWCKTCPDFQDMLVHHNRYGTTPEGVAILALRQCTRPPVPQPKVNPDGTEREYWETQLPTCKLGESKLAHDAELAMRRLGLNIVNLTTKNAREVQADKTSE